MQRQRHLVQARHAERVAPAQAVGAQQFGARRALGAGDGAAEVHAAAHHGLGQRVDRRGGDGRVQHHGAAAHHGDRVAQGHDLLELVRDQQDGGAPIAQPAQGDEQLLGLCGVSTAVGSSRIRMRAPRYSALRISSRWRSPTGRSSPRVQVDLQAGVAHQRSRRFAHDAPRHGQAPVPARRRASRCPARSACPPA
jgi:hypothetical protein